MFFYNELISSSSIKLRADFTVLLYHNPVVTIELFHPNNWLTGSYNWTLLEKSKLASSDMKQLISHRMHVYYCVLMEVTCLQQAGLVRVLTDLFVFYTFVFWGFFFFHGYFNNLCSWQSLLISFHTEKKSTDTNFGIYAVLALIVVSWMAVVGF